MVYAANTEENKRKSMLEWLPVDEGDTQPPLSSKEMKSIIKKMRKRG